MRIYPVQKSPCRTCPFAGEKPLNLGLRRMSECLENLAGNGQHICHSSNNTKICRGGRDLQLKWLVKAGMLEEPTDEAFNEAINWAVGE